MITGVFVEISIFGNVEENLHWGSGSGWFLALRTILSLTNTAD
jgi:hypothetical protein